MNLDSNDHYDEYTRYMENYDEYRVSEIAEDLAAAIQRQIGEKIKDWTHEYKLISEIAEHIYITDVCELESTLDKFNPSDIQPNLTAIELQDAIYEVLEIYRI